ncbi:MAG TPA: glycosyltransferase family 2 protein [Opitutaceae bacterium]
MNTPSISFLVPLFNRLDLTEKFVENLRATVPGDWGWEALLIDDGSTDGTPSFIDGLRAPFRALHMPGNVGYATAMNTGAGAALGSILALLNNDLVLTKGWLEPMLDLLRDEPNVGAVGNIQTNPATGLIDHAGVFFDPEGMPTHAHKHRGRPPRGKWRERNACTAACMLVPRTVFDDVGGFCTEYRNGMEDIDLCVRLRDRGYRIIVSHESVIEHLVSSSPGRHEANSANTEIYRRRCAAIAARWGAKEWPMEYLQRYARRWWKIDPSRGARAVLMLLGLPRRRNKNPVA